MTADVGVTAFRRHLGDRYADARPDRLTSSTDALEQHLPNLMSVLRRSSDCGWDDLMWQVGEALWELYLYRGLARGADRGLRRGRLCRGAARRRGGRSRGCLCSSLSPRDDDRGVPR